jgi:hypothetical protein
MTLWSHESEYCICGHHIADHEGVGVSWYTTGTNSVGVDPNPRTGAYAICRICKECKEFIAFCVYI